MQEFILAVIVSIDIFLVAATYSSGKIRIPPLSAAVICLISAVLLGFSLILADLISRILPLDICEIFGFILLISIGIITIFKSLFRTFIRRISQQGEMSLRPKSGGLVIKLYLDDTAADVDESKILSPKEAFALALVGSLDCIAMGLGCGYNAINPVTSAFLTFVTGFAAIILGGAVGRRVAEMKHDLSWLGGAALIAFAVCEFVK